MRESDRHHRCDIWFRYDYFLFELARLVEVYWRRVSFNRSIDDFTLFASITFTHYVPYPTYVGENATKPKEDLHVCISCIRARGYVESAKRCECKIRYRATILSCFIMYSHVTNLAYFLYDKSSSRTDVDDSILAAATLAITSFISK